MNRTEETNTVTVAIVEDDRRFSHRLVLAVRSAPPLRCVGLCPTRAEALAQLSGWKPDVVLLDLDLGSGRDGLDILPDLVRQLPDTKFLVLTVVDDPAAIFQAAQLGASGYLRKSLPLAELPAAILEVQDGLPRFSPEVLRLIWQSFRNPPADTQERSKLSPREAELLELLAQGYESKELATRFNLSPETVKTHIRNVHHKLLVSTTQQALQKVYPTKRFRLLPRWMRGGQPVR
jgi:DNA-binding NarL/FixJ family response regulator